MTFGQNLDLRYTKFLDLSDARRCTITNEISVTKSGKTCQSWMESYPHHPTYYPTNPSQAKNYCRNPDNDSKAEL